MKKKMKSEEAKVKRKPSLIKFLSNFDMKVLGLSFTASLISLLWLPFHLSNQITINEAFSGIRRIKRAEER